MPTTLPTLSDIARDALATLSRLSQDTTYAYCVGRHPWDLADHTDACPRRVADDMGEQLRTLQAYARTYAGDPEMGIWSAVRFGYISDTLADELVNVAAGAECPAAVTRAFHDALEAAGLEDW